MHYIIEEKDKKIERRSHMTNNNIILLNDIILKTYSITNFDEMRKTVLSSLRYLIPSLGSVFYLASKQKQYNLTSGIGYGEISEESITLYLKEFQEYDKTTWAYATPVAKAYNDSAFIQNEYNQSTDFYQKIYAPHRIYYQVTLTIIHNGIFLGIISLFRTIEEGDFQQEELFQLELLSVHLGVRLYQNLQTIKETQDHHPNPEMLLNTYHLTLREVEVLYAILNEKEKNKICETLCISPNTLKKHIMNVYKKFGVNSRIELYHALKVL